MQDLHRVGLAALGVGLGVATSAALTWTMASLLFGVTPADPMTQTEVAEKAHGLLQPVIGEKAQQLVKAVFALEQVTRMDDFGKLLQPD